MRIIFALIAVAALANSAIFALESTSAIHQILAAITFLVFTVAGATFAILGALAKMHSPAQIIGSARPPGDSPPASSIFPDAPTKSSGTWVKVGK